MDGLPGLACVRVRVCADRTGRSCSGSHGATVVVQGLGTLERVRRLHVLEGIHRVRLRGQGSGRSRVRHGGRKAEIQEIHRCSAVPELGVEGRLRRLRGRLDGCRWEGGWVWLWCRRCLLRDHRRLVLLSLRLDLGLNGRGGLRSGLQEGLGRRGRRRTSLTLLIGLLRLGLGRRRSRSRSGH